MDTEPHNKTVFILAPYLYFNTPSRALSSNAYPPANKKKPSMACSQPQNTLHMGSAPNSTWDMSRSQRVLKAKRPSLCEAAPN